MIEPTFGNAVRRAISDVSAGLRPASVLDGPVALHQAALLWDFADDAEPGDLLALAEHPQLARGTLLMLYWRAAPGYFLRYASPAEVPSLEREGYETCQALAATYLRRSDLRDGIGFDPRDDDGYDRTTAYDDEPRRGEFTSSALLDAVPGETVAWPTDPDQLTRAPDAAEQVVIAAGIARGRALLPGLPADALPRAVAEAVADALRRTGPATSDDLAWVWLNALDWTWQCGDSATDGVLSASCVTP